MSGSDSGTAGPRASAGQERSAKTRPAAAIRIAGARRNGVRQRRREDRRDERAGSRRSKAAEAFSPEEGLLAAARAAREFAQAQYSNFKVGAALETVDGQIVSGCNIENATYGLTLCAERVALVKALSEGHTVFTRIAVVADTEAPTPPCGPCRQLLWEYCGDVEVVLGNLRAADRPLPAFVAAAAAVRSAVVVMGVSNGRARWRQFPTSKS